MNLVKQKENPNRKLYFKGIKLWNMPVPTIEKEIRELWEEVNKVIHEGIQIEYKNVVIKSSKRITYLK